MHLRFRTVVPVLSLLLLMVAVSACTVSVGKDKGSDTPPAPTPDTKPNPNRVNWQAVPSQFHPETKDIAFTTNASIEKIVVDTFGDDNVEVVYSNTMAAGSGILRMYSVWNESAVWGSTAVRTESKAVRLQSSGQYQCSIKVENGSITALKGGCYVLQQVILPTGSTIEVYKGDELISKRFIAMSNDTFMEQIDRASFDKDRQAVIADYLKSYQDVGRAPQLTAAALGKVLHPFSFKDAKMQALSQLHVYVTDRQNLGQMIDNEFSYFDRQDARKIVGL